MKKIIWAIGIIMVSGLIVAFCMPRNKDITKPIIKIGILLPLTGNSAFAGIPVQKAINIALEDINSERKLKYTYEVIYSDTQNNQKKALTNATGLNSINKVNAYITMWSPAGLTVSPYAEKNKKIHIGCSWGYDIAKGYYNFNHATFPDEQADALIKELKKKNITKLGMIWLADKAQQELVEIIKNKLTQNNIEVSFDNMVIGEPKDFKTLIMKMKQKDAQMLLILMLPPSINILSKQMKEEGYDIPKTSIEYFTYVPDLFEGQWYISDALGTSDFGADMKKRTGEDLNSCMANLYDSLKILINAYEITPLKEGQIVPENDAVSKTILDMKKIRSVMGKITIDQEGNIHTKPTLKIIKNGKPEIIKGK